MIKKIIILLIAVISIVVLFFFYHNGVFEKAPDDKQYISEQINSIKNYWRIDIDNKYDVTYHKISDFSFRGDGLKYFVLHLSDNNQIKQISLNQTESKSFEKEFITAINSEKDFQRLPDFSKKYNWSKSDRDNDTLFLVFFPDNLELYILESKI